MLFALRRHRLERRKGWRYFFLSLLTFALWDVCVFIGQLAAAQIDTSGFRMPGPGWDYFRKELPLENAGYVYYAASFDYILLVAAQWLFYRGLREHHVQAEKAGVTSVSLVVPLWPVFTVSFAGAALFFVLSALCLIESVRLFRRDRDDILWNYLVWLCAAFFLFSLSRSLGHVLQHILTSAGAAETWRTLAPISGSINIFALIVVGSVSLFFIKIYDIHTRTLEDKAEIERINRDLTELNQELEDVVAERTMGLFALTVADKVRNPAAVIGIVCKRVIRKQQAGERLGEELQDVIQECEKLHQVVGDFQNFLGAKRSIFAFDNLNDVVREVVSIVSREAEEKGVLLSVQLFEKPLRINMQKSLLRVAIFHVLRNAVDATFEGGLVRLSTRGDEESVTLVVYDTGVGIAAEDMERIFDVSFSTKRRGYGMGLPLVRQIVTEHLGEVKVESETGKGTALVMAFPVRWKQAGLPGN